LEEFELEKVVDIKLLKRYKLSKERITALPLVQQRQDYNLPGLAKAIPGFLFLYNNGKSFYIY